MMSESGRGRAEGRVSEWVGGWMGGVRWIRYLRKHRGVRPTHQTPQTARWRRHCDSRHPRACISLWSVAAGMREPWVIGRTGWCGGGRGRGTAHDESKLGLSAARFWRSMSERMERTAFWAAGLFCTAVPMTHNTCTFKSSEEEANKSCSGSHMPSFSRSL